MLKGAAELTTKPASNVLFVMLVPYCLFLVCLDSNTQAYDGKLLFSVVVILEKSMSRTHLDPTSTKAINRTRFCLQH